MAHPYSDFEVLPELAKNSKTLMRLEEYVHYMIEATQYWQENKYMVKNEIRETFSAVSSILHQREMQLYQQVDTLVNRINYHNAAVDMARSNCSDSVKISSPNADANKIFSSGSYISPPLKLKFQSNFECLEEAIRSFGYAEIQDDKISDDSNFVFVNSAEDHLNGKANHVSMHQNDIDQSDVLNKMEVSSIVSSNSSDSFEVLSDNKALAPLPRNSNSNIKVFVSNLPDGCRSEDLQELFEKYGCVTECFVVRKCGCVVMRTSEEAEYAIKALNNFEFNGSSLLVEGVKLSHTSSLNPHSTIKMADASGSSGLHPHSATLTDVSHNPWLRKVTVPTPELPPYVALSRNLASVISSGDTSKIKLEPDSSSAAHSDNAHSIVSDLSSHLESSGTLDHDQNSDGVAAESRTQNPPVSASSSSSMPDFHSVIKKMFGNGNCNWLNRKDCVPPPGCHGTKEIPDLALKSRSWLSRTVSQNEGSLLVQINSIEKSQCPPAYYIKKMFNPYFEKQDKNNWLVKDHRFQKDSLCS